MWTEIKEWTKEYWDIIFKIMVIILCVFVITSYIAVSCYPQVVNNQEKTVKEEAVADSKVIYNIDSLRKWNDEYNMLRLKLGKVCDQNLGYRLELQKKRKKDKLKHYTEEEKVKLWEYINEIRDIRLRIYELKYLYNDNVGYEIPEELRIKKLPKWLD